MTTLTAIADKAARLVFYGLILAAPACGDGSDGDNAAPNQAHALTREHTRPALRQREHMPSRHKRNLRIECLPH